MWGGEERSRATWIYWIRGQMATDSLIWAPVSPTHDADWRGYLVALFALVWIANEYMSIYNRIRLDIKHEQVEIKADEQTAGERKSDNERKAA